VGECVIPVEEALRKVAQFIALGPSVENANVLRSLSSAEVIPMAGT
jgi:hypothetical protein